MSVPRTPRFRSLLAGAATVSVIAAGAVPVLSAQAAPTTPDVSSEDVTAESGEVVRIGGADRYGTAAAAALAYPAGSTDTVMLASGEVFPDAMSGRLPGAQPALSLQNETQEAVGQGTPLLLTKADRLPAVTADALEQLRPQRVVILGGSAAVSTAVEDAVRALVGDVERIGGADRYDTSAQIAAQFPAQLPVLYVATGTDFPDALAGGARASLDGVPLLLTDPGRLRPVSAETIAALDPASVVVLGGPAAVSDTVVDAIAEIVPDTVRVYGQDRYDTASIIAAASEFDTPAFLASGVSYPDALTGGVMAGFYGSPLLLTRPTGLPAVTQESLEDLSPQSLVLLGGTGAVAGAVQDQLDERLPLWVDEMVVQMLSFNDYHGHIAVDEGARLTPEQDPEQHPVGGAVNLSTTLDMLRTRSAQDKTLTVAAGDLIGGSTFLSGLFRDEPAVETLEVAGLDISSVGNHEFDEGVEELLRMQHGGCHPEDGCFEEEPYDGADFQWLAANVVDKETGEPILPATEVRTIQGVDVGFIGMTLEETPTLVSPAGIASVDFLDEVETANAQAAELTAQGVDSIVVLLHEGGFQAGSYQGCDGISGPIVAIAEQLDPAIDAVVTGHTHQPYVCMIDDPAGQPRSVTSANQYARVVTETRLAVSQSSGDVLRDRVVAANSLVLQAVPDDPEMAAVVAKWEARAEVLAGQVVGTVAEDITGDAGGDRGIETPMANLVADAILFGTEGEDQGGADIAFMNVGGVRASLLVDQITNDEEPGEVTYEEAYNVAPFGNILVSVDLTGAQVKAVLEQQYVPGRGRPYLALGVSEGFTYTWDDTRPEGSKVSEMVLDGEPLVLEETYRVATLNFLAEGGDQFTAFTAGTNLLGGPDDLANLVAYLRANPDLTAPEDRVNGL